MALLTGNCGPQKAIGKLALGTRSKAPGGFSVPNSFSIHLGGHKGG